MQIIFTIVLLIGHIICYNIGAGRKGKLPEKIKAGKIMNANINLDTNQNKELGLVSENCNCSIYSMLTVAGGILLAIGTVIYSAIVM